MVGSGREEAAPPETGLTLDDFQCKSTVFGFFFFWIWTIFKVFIGFVIILLLFYVLVFWPRGMWDLSFLTRDCTLALCIGKGSLNHWTIRKVPPLCF